MKKKIDNIEFFYDFMTFERPGDFYHVQIMLRKKDEPTAPANNRLIKAYYIYSAEQLRKYADEIRTLCEATNSRAYINPGRKNMRGVVLKTIEQFAKRMSDGNLDLIHREFNSACGTILPEQRIWVIDVDDISMTPKLLEWLAQRKTPVHAILPSVTGEHILTSKFNSKEFGEDFPNIDLHKNNPTLLYYCHEI